MSSTNKTNKIIFVSIIILAVIITIICIFSVKNHDDIIISDAIKFKTEYESLNGLTNESNNKTYPNVVVNAENPIIYKTDSEILDVLNNESAVIYFGFEKCPWCRNMIEPLLKAASNNKLSKIYYVNIYSIRDTYEIKDNVVTKTFDGTESYQKILAFFKDKLSEYYLTDTDGKKYDTNTTRLYAPTVIAVKNGEITSLHAVTVDSQTDPYVELTTDQKKELTDIYDNLIKSLDEDACSASNPC